MKKRSWRLLVALSVALPFAASSRADDHGSHRLDGLKPGQLVVHKLNVPVRIVLIGFDQDQVDDAFVLLPLPETYTPVVRFPQFYGLNGRNLGLEYRLRYDVVRKGRRFTNAFFSYLEQIGVEGPLTPFQALYNDQDNNILNVTGPVLYIDGPKVEKWLDENDADPRGDRGYTIYYVNWYGRDDFKFHVYTKTDEPDPDTDYNFGVRRGSRKMVAWGGTHSRRWFYDFSAGPESWAGNYDVDNPDIDGDSVPDYRIPPIWEYDIFGHRFPFFLGIDMGLLARFVGIDLLFTTSPLYDPLVTAPAPAGAKVAHVAMLEDDPGSSGLDWIDKDFARARWRRFQPYYRWKVGLTDTDPIDPGAKRALNIFTGLLGDSDCWNDFGTPFAQLFCYFSANLATYIPEYRPRDYVDEVFAFNTTAANLGDLFGLLGFADDDWTTGTQSHVFMFGAPEYRELGFGHTTTAIHEVGHHLGMSHPHDGWDSEFEFDFGPGGSLYFAWAGDESDTVMHYLSLSNGFGRFDQDNLYRWETAGYLNWSNEIVAGILASKEKHEVWHLVEAADLLAKHAQRALKNWDYLDGARRARGAYDLLAVAARRIGVPTPTAAVPLRQAGAKAGQLVCKARFMDR